MKTAAEIPVLIPADAAARVQELGMQREFEAMLEHTKQAVENLRSIEVELYDDPHEPGELPRLFITAWKNGRTQIDDPTAKNWDFWVFQTFSPDVSRWFSFQAICWDDYGR